MRKGKPKRKTERKLESRALDHAPELASRVRGFAFTAEDDALFALGYPHLCLLYDDEDEPVAAAEKLVLSGYPYRDVEFPRQAVTLLGRALPGGTCIHWLPGAVAALNDQARQALATPGPLQEDELPGLINRLLSVPSPSTDHLLYIYEALLGTAHVVGVVTAALERTSKVAFFERPPVAALWLNALALMLERLPPAVAAPLLGRLRAWADLPEPARSESGVRAIHHEPLVDPPQPVVRASQEQLVVARRVRAVPWYTLPDPRLVLLGGDGVHRIEIDLWRKYGPPYTPGEAHRLILARMGKIRSPLTVELVAAMFDKSKAKPAVAAWVRAHREYARPHLEALVAAGGPVAVPARALLEQVD